jgi:hypothetical protein
MGLHSSPSPAGRPTISARQAGKLLRRDQRTVQRMIKEGQLEGGCQLINERRRWFVYSDQIGQQEQSAAPADYQDLAQAVAVLRAEVAAARASAASAQETNRLLLANQAIMLNALNDYRQASDDTAAIAEDYRALTERHGLIAARYRRSADSFAQALGNYRDIVGQVLTPDDLSSLDDTDPTL